MARTFRFWFQNRFAKIPRTRANKRTTDNGKHFKQRDLQSFKLESKKGWGWVVLLMLLGIMAFMLKIAISIFREMAGGASGSDWDG